VGFGLSQRRLQLSLSFKEHPAGIMSNYVKASTIFRMNFRISLLSVAGILEPVMLNQSFSASPFLTNSA